MSSARRPRHGIASAGRITPEPADFIRYGSLGKVPRTVAVSKLNEYIAKNGLRTPENRIQINLHDALKKLLCPAEGHGPVTFLSLGRLVGTNFPEKTDEERKADAEARLQAKKENKLQEENKKQIIKDEKEIVNVRESKSGGQPPVKKHKTSDSLNL